MDRNNGSTRSRITPVLRVVVAAGVGVSLGWFGMTVRSHAQTYAPSPGSVAGAPTPYQGNTELEDNKRGDNASANELERTPVYITPRAPVPVVPPQPYMSEVRWRDVIGRDIPDDTPSFFRDSLVQVVARTYLLTRDNLDGSRSAALAGGGWIAYRSGLIADFIGIGGAFYTSERIFGNPDESGTLLLTPNQGNINTLGQAYVRAQLLEQEFRGGRQLIDTPLINPRDNRMVPITYTAATMSSLPDKERNIDYTAGYLWETKLRDSNDFIPMSEALAGMNALNRGAPFGMIKFRPITGLSLIAMDYNIQDYINTGFAQAEYAFQTPKGTPQWAIGANWIDQRSNGTNLLTGSPFETYQASAKLQLKLAGFTAFVAGSATGNESSIFSPFGTKPNYTDMQQLSFDQAGEKAIGGSLAYDLGYAFDGLNGLSIGAWYSQGWGSINATTLLSLPNQQELDIWFQYRPTEGPLKGLRLKVQYADVWQSGSLRGSQPEFRFITDYTVLFKNQ